MYKKNYIQNGKTKVVFVRHPTKTSSTSTWLWKPHLFTAKLRQLHQTKEDTYRSGDEALYKQARNSQAKGGHTKS